MKTIAQIPIRRWLYIALWLSLSGLSCAATVGRAAVHAMCKTSDSFRDNLVAPLDLERWDGRNVAFSLLANTIELASRAGASVQVNFVDADKREEQQYLRLISVDGLQPMCSYEIYVPKDGAFEENYLSLLREVYLAYTIQLSVRAGRLSGDSTREEFMGIYRQAYLSSVEMVSGSLSKDLAGWIKSQNIKFDQARWIIPDNPNPTELLKNPSHAQVGTLGSALFDSYHDKNQENKSEMATPRNPCD